MAQRRAHIHHHRHPGYSYPVLIHQRVYGAVIVPLMVVIIAAIVVQTSPLTTAATGVSPVELISALAASFGRLLAAYVCAAILALPLALLINRNSLSERLLLPVFDVLQSIPVLAFFPAVILFFLQYEFLSGAAIFITFLTMLWSLVFSLVGGLREIPDDVRLAARVFGINGFNYLRRIVAPAIFPFFVTGSLLAWASGWNILIVAEVLQTYVPANADVTNLFGIGSVMVAASASGQSNMFIAAIVTMVVVIAAMNFFVWQRLLRISEHYRFE